MARALLVEMGRNSAHPSPLFPRSIEGSGLHHLRETGCRGNAKVGKRVAAVIFSRRDFVFSLLAAVGSGCKVFTPAQESLADVRRRYERELLGNVVPFWMRHSIDTTHGGFLTCLDRDGNVYDTFKHLWMQWREVYMFAALWNAGYRDSRYLDVAIHGFDFLQRCGRRPDGSYHYMLNRDGSVLCDTDGGQEVFTESFAAIGCAELYRATGDVRYKEEALNAYGIYRCNTEKGSGKYDLLAYPMIELNVVQTLDAAFGGYGKEIDSCIRRIVRFAHPESGIQNRMPSIGNDQPVIVKNLRTDIIALPGTFGKRGDGVDTGECVSGALDIGGTQSCHIAESGKEALFEGERFFFGAEDAAFEFFEFRGDEAFGINQSLFLSRSLSSVLTERTVHRMP